MRKWTSQSVLEGVLQVLDNPQPVEVATIHRYPPSSEHLHVFLLSLGRNASLDVLKTLELTELDPNGDSLIALAPGLRTVILTTTTSHMMKMASWLIRRDVEVQLIRDNAVKKVRRDVIVPSECRRGCGIGRQTGRLIMTGGDLQILGWLQEQQQEMRSGGRVKLLENTSQAGEGREEDLQSSALRFNSKDQT